jgi:hypothetical protein
MPQVDLPPEYFQAPQRGSRGGPCVNRFDQTPVGSTLFLVANRLIKDWGHSPCVLLTDLPTPTG